MSVHRPTAGQSAAASFAGERANWHYRFGRSKIELSKSYDDTKLEIPLLPGTTDHAGYWGRIPSPPAPAPGTWWRASIPGFRRPRDNPANWRLQCPENHLSWRRRD